MIYSWIKFKKIQLLTDIVFYVCNVLAKSLIAYHNCFLSLYFQSPCFLSICLFNSWPFLFCEHFVTILAMQLFVFLVGLPQNFTMTLCFMVSYDFFSGQCFIKFLSSWVGTSKNILLFLLLINVSVHREHLFVIDCSFFRWPFCYNLYNC